MRIARPVTESEAGNVENVLSGASGPRTDKNGRILAYSLLGSVEEFQALAGKPQTPTSSQYFPAPEEGWECEARVCRDGIDLDYFRQTVVD